MSENNLDTTFFPWDLYFSDYDTEINTAKNTCETYSLEILKLAAKAVNAKPSSKKTTNCDNILKSIQKLKKENASSLIELKKNIKKIFHDSLPPNLIASNNHKNIISNNLSVNKLVNKSFNNQNKEPDSINASIEAFKEIFDKGIKATSLHFRKKCQPTSLSIPELNNIFETTKNYIKTSTETMSPNDKKSFILNEIQKLQKDANNLNSTNLLVQTNPEETSLIEAIQLKQNKKKSKVTPLQESKKEDNSDDELKHMISYMKEKGWKTSNNSSKEQLSELLMTNMINEEKTLKEQEKQIHHELERTNLLYSQTQEELAEQQQLVKELKTIKKKTNPQLVSAENEYNKLKNDVTSIRDQLIKLKEQKSNIQSTRETRNALCHQLNYDDLQLDTILIKNDLDCDKDNVCNLNTNKCEPKSDNVYSFNYKDQNIILSPSEKAKELEIKLKNNNTVSPRFVSLETPDNKVIYDESEENDEVEDEIDNDEVEDDEKEEDDEVEELDKNYMSDTNYSDEEEDIKSPCFIKKQYETVQQIENDFACPVNTVCDISTSKCEDKSNVEQIETIGTIQYTTDKEDTNKRFIDLIKQKFKHSVIKEQKSSMYDSDQPVINMDKSPLHVSERIPLDKYVSIMKQIESKPRLSVDERFNERTKARRDMIRKCLNL